MEKVLRRAYAIKKGNKGFYREIYYEEWTKKSEKVDKIIDSFALILK
jgi:hypothetical protein